MTGVIIGSAGFLIIVLFFGVCVCAQSWDHVKETIARSNSDRRPSQNGQLHFLPTTTQEHPLAWSIYGAISPPPYSPPSYTTALSPSFPTVYLASNAVYYNDLLSGYKAESHSWSDDELGGELSTVQLSEDGRVDENQQAALSPASYEDIVMISVV